MAWRSQSWGGGKGGGKAAGGKPAPQSVKPPQQQAAKPVPAPQRSGWSNSGASLGGKGAAASWPQPQQRPMPAQQGVKRAATPPPGPAQPVKKPMPVAPGASSSSTGASTNLRVTTQKKNDVVTTTLVGTFAEKGTNHGKKCYQKIEKIPGHEHVKVWLYYWDKRDGDDFSGWWFGDALGGQQVWARAAMDTPQPPKTGWRLPWDAPKPEAGNILIEPASSSASSASITAAPGSRPTTPRPNAPAASAGPPVPSPAMRLKKATELVNGVELQSKAVINHAQKLLSNVNSTADQLKQTTDSLTKFQTKVTEAQTAVVADINEVRKVGAPAVSQGNELQKLLTKVKTIQTSVSTELAKIKVQHQKVVSGKQKAEIEQKKKADEAKEKAAKKQAEEAEKKKEVADMKEFKDHSPKVKAAVTTVGELVTKIESTAAALVESPPGETQELNTKLQEVEKMANEAQKKLGDARTDASVKQTNARKYAPEARKAALAEYTPLIAKLADLQQQLAPYKVFKKEFNGRVEARKSLTDILSKLNDAEVEIEKANNMVQSSDVNQMSEDEIKGVDEVMKPILQTLASAGSLIAQKQKSASSSMSAELTSLKSRTAQLKASADAVTAKVKGQREGIQVQEFVAQAREKIEKAEQALETCQEAEMPFLKGIEVLPKEESDKALSASEKAAREATELIVSVKGFVQSKLGVARSFRKEVMQQAVDQLNPYKERADAADTKLKEFKKETDERKANALVAEVLDAILKAESKAEELTSVSKLLNSDGLESAPVDKLKEALSKTEAAEKEALAAVGSARSAMAAKQGDKNAKAGIQKVSARLKEVQDSVSKQRQKIVSSKTLVKTKEILASEGGKVTEAEGLIEKADGEVSKGAGLTAEVVLQVEELLGEAEKKTKAIPTTLKPFIATAAAKMKEELQKLVDRAAKVQQGVEKIKKDTKDEREKVLKELYVKEATAKAQNVEDVAEKMNDAELPYLKGLEVLPLQEALDCIVASEAAAKATQEAVTDARNYIATKTVEAKKFQESKDVTEGFAKCTEQVNAAVAKLTVFKKETEDRKKAAQMQQAGVKVGEVEDFLKKFVEAAEPFSKEGAETIVADENSDVLQNFTKLEKELQTKVTDARTFLTERRAVAAKGGKEQMEGITKLFARLSEVQQEITKAKKSLDAVNAKCKALVDSCYKTAAKALRDELQKKSLSCEQLFAELSKNGNEIAEADFCKKLTSLEGFSIEPVHAKLLCRKISGDGLTLRKFMKYIQLYYKAIKAIAMTDILDVASCKTKRKAEQDEILEVLEGPVVDEGSKLERIRGRCVLDLSEGWVTIKGNNGSQFLTEVLKPYYVAIKSDITLKADFAAESATVRTVKDQEVLELIEGPKKVEFPDVKRAKVKSNKDNAVGWITLVDKQGAVFAEANQKLYVCTQSIAMTDGQDIKTCKVVRKLAVGEFFEISGEIAVDKEASVSRIEGKALKDGKSGWITVKGNAGTVYAEPTTKYYTVKAEVPLEKRPVSGGDSTRNLEVGEALQLIEGPKAEKVQAESRVKVRCVSDKQVGWISQQKDSIKSWTGIYKCVGKVNLEETQAGGEGVTVVKELAQGDALEHMEGPVEVGTNIRLKGKSNKDGSVGWVTIKDEAGKRYVVC